MFTIVIISVGVVCNALGTPLFQPVIPGNVGTTTATASTLSAVPQISEITNNSIDELPNNTNASAQNTQLVYIKSAFGPYTYTVVPVPRLKSFPGKRQFFWSGSSPMSSQNQPVNQTGKAVVAPVALTLPISNMTNSTSQTKI